MVQRVDASSFSGITPSMNAAFDADGVIVFDGLLPPDSCGALMARMSEIIKDFDADAHHATFKSAGADQTWENHLMESGREIRFFFEDEALDEDGRLTTGVRAGLNKVGHALHDKDDLYSEFSRQEAFRQIAEGLGGNPGRKPGQNPGQDPGQNPGESAPRLLQSMHIFKPPRIGGEVVCHQDATYLWTDPQSCLGIWVALEDATTENGCLWGIPGAHKEANPRMRWRRRDDGSGADMEVLDGRDWPEEDCVPLEAACGTVIVFDGQFPHRSSANRSDRSREAYTLHVIDGDCAYPDDNWLCWPDDDPVTGFGGQ